MIKDLREVKGWRVSYGSAKFKENIARFSRSFVDELLSKGAVLFGQTASCEFGALPVTESEAHGICRNPWDLVRTPGGSSGGAGAAVAAGMVPIAHASDGGGSIRIPASCCGLVGFKSSRGLIPPGPVLCEPPISVQGVITRSVMDQAIFFDDAVTEDLMCWAPQQKK